MEGFKFDRSVLNHGQVVNEKRRGVKTMFLKTFENPDIKSHKSLLVKSIELGFPRSRWTFTNIIVSHESTDSL